MCTGRVRVGEDRPRSAAAIVSRFVEALNAGDREMLGTLSEGSLRFALTNSTLRPALLRFVDDLGEVSIIPVPIVVEDERYALGVLSLLGSSAGDVVDMYCVLVHHPAHDAWKVIEFGRRLTTEEL